MGLWPSEAGAARTVADPARVLGVQIADRMSKGIREAPTKALMGELAVKSGDRPEQAFGGCCTLTSSDVSLESCFIQDGSRHLP